MQATVNLQEVIQELFGLSGFYPEIRLNTRNWTFTAVTNLHYSDGRVVYEAITASDSSADVAILRAYQMLFEISDRHFIESGTTGYRWKFDPETEGWVRQNGRY